MGPKPKSGFKFIFLRNCRGIIYWIFEVRDHPSRKMIISRSFRCDTWEVEDVIRFRNKWIYNNLTMLLWKRRHKECMNEIIEIAKMHSQVPPGNGK